MNKKFTSAVLAGAMALSMTGISAFAADTNLKAGGETTLTATAAFAPVAIDVVLPSSITAAINPYKIDYKFTGETAGSGTSGVISPVYEIENKTTDYGVKVAAKVWASTEKGSKVSIATVDSEGAAPTFKNDNTEEKQIFAYLNTTVAADKSFANDTYTADDTTQVLFTEDEPDNAVLLMQIAKATGKGYFQIQGDCVEEPEEKWAATDKVDLNIIFDINPYNDSAAGGGGSTELTASGVTMTGTGGTYAISLAEAAAKGQVITLTAPTGKTITGITDTNTRNTVNVAAGTITLDTTIRSGDNGTITVTYDDSSTATIAVTITA